MRASFPTSNVNPEALERDAQLWSLYERLFPRSEREPPEVFMRALVSGRGRVLRLLGPGGTEGFSAVHLLESPAAVFLVYLAVEPALARGGRGTALVEASWAEGQAALLGRGLTPRTYLWEVEDPEHAANAGERALRLARIGFFEGRGGRLLACPYAQPPLHGVEPVPMRLMARTPEGTLPSSEEQAALVRAIYLEKYGALNGLSRESLEALLAATARGAALGPTGGLG